MALSRFNVLSSTPKEETKPLYDCTSAIRNRTYYGQVLSANAPYSDNLNSLCCDSNDTKSDMVPMIVIIVATIIMRALILIPLYRLVFSCSISKGKQYRVHWLRT